MASLLPPPVRGISSGRPKGSKDSVKRATKVQRQDVAAVAREHTEEAVKALVRIMRKRSASDSAVVAAATALLDRGYGKPPQHIDAHVDWLDQLSDTDRRALEGALVALSVGQVIALAAGPETEH